MFRHRVAAGTGQVSVKITVRCIETGVPHSNFSCRLKASPGARGGEGVAVVMLHIAGPAL